MSKPEIAPLCDAPIGDLVEVVGLVGDRNARWRLMDLGLIAGTKVEVLRASPLGDPILYRFRGTTIALRRTDAAIVQVRRIAPAALTGSNSERGE